MAGLTIYGIVTFLLIAGTLVSLQLKHKDMEIGKIASMYAGRYSLSVSLVLVILFALAEALLAASIHPKNEIATNDLARYITHWSLAMASIVFAMGGTKEMTKLGTKTGDFRSKIPILASALIQYALAIGLPILNMMLIVGASKETPELIAFFYWIVGNNAMVEEIISVHRFQRPFSPWDALSYNVKSTIAVTTVHLIVMVFEAIQTYSLTNTHETVRDMFSTGDSFSKPKEDKKEEKKEEDRKRGATEEKKSEKAEEKKEEKKEPKEASKTDEDLLKKSLTEILTYWGLKSTRLETQVAAAAKEFDDMAKSDEKKFNSFGVRIADLSADIKKAKPGDKDILERIKTLFANSPKNPTTPGLGRPLPNG